MSVCGGLGGSVMCVDKGSDREEGIKYSVCIVAVILSLRLVKLLLVSS